MSYTDVVNSLKKKTKKEFVDMTDPDYVAFMDAFDKETLMNVKEYLITSRDFFKKVMLEEYRKKNPNSFRYRDAEEQIAKYNNKGKLLKTILDNK